MEVSPTQYKVIEAVFMTTLGVVCGAVCGGILGMVIFPLARRNPRNLAASLSRTQYARAYAPEWSAFCTAWFGTNSIVRGIRGKDDLTSEMVSGSGGGLAYSFVSQGFKVKPAHAFYHAAVSAIVSGTVYKCPRGSYTEARDMLSTLGLEEYEKNFKKAHLTDPTLPLLTDSDLKEVNIPLGARLLILDHIKRYNKMVNRK